MEGPERAARKRARARNGGGRYADHSDGSHALYAPFPAEREASYYEEPGFNATQLEELAHVVAELNKEFDERVERMRQGLLETMIRLVRSGECAEQQVHLLTDRLALLENHVERRLKAALTDSNVLDLPKNFWKRGDATQ